MTGSDKRHSQMSVRRCWPPALLLLFGLAAGLLPAPLRAEDGPVLLYGDEHQPPFVRRDEPVGLFREATEEMLRRAGQPYTLILTPWRRAQAEVLSGGGGLIMNLARTPARESEYRWLVNVLPTPYVLVGLGRDYSSLEEAFTDGPVVTLAGTPRADEAVNIGGAARVITVNDPQQAVRLLQAGRVVAWYEIDLRVLHAWRSAGLDVNALHIGPPQQVVSSYLAANPGLPEGDQLEARLRMAFASMRADGTWERILGAYIGMDRARLIAVSATD